MTLKPGYLETTKRKLPHYFSPKYVHNTCFIKPNSKCFLKKKKKKNGLELRPLETCIYWDCFAIQQKNELK